MRYYQEIGSVYWWIAGAPVRVPDWATLVLVGEGGAVWAVENEGSPRPAEIIGHFNGWGSGSQLYKKTDAMTDSCPIMLTARAVQTWAI